MKSEGWFRSNNTTGGLLSLQVYTQQITLIFAVANNTTIITSIKTKLKDDVGMAEPKSTQIRLNFVGVKS